MAQRPTIPCSGGCGKLMWNSRSTADNPKCRPCRKRDGDWWSNRESAAELRGSRSVMVACACGAIEERPWSPRPTTRCIDCRRDREQEMAERRHARWQELNSRDCEWCGTTFAPTYGTPEEPQRGCCLSHGKLIVAIDRRRQSVEIVADPRGKLWGYELAEIRSLGANRQFYSCKCGSCGERFIATTATVWCSRECEIRPLEISRAKRERLYRRDEWKCQICHFPMSRKYSATDPWSPSLDHIVPRSLGGDHSDDNLRSAHAICNAYRGAGVMSDQEIAEVVSCDPRTTAPA